nr:transglutaminaseTgpA domain-containing protein [Nonomuraea sp. FMUSA5-5]
MLGAAAGLAFDGVFALEALWPVVAVAAGGPGVVALLLAGRVPLWGVIPVSVLAWLTAVSATLFRAEAWLGFVPSPAAVRAALVGVRDAGGQLLTTILPAAPDSTAVVLVSFLVWAATTAGAELALRSRAVLLPALAALPVLAVAIVFGVAGAGSAVPYAAVFAGLVLLLALVRSGRSLGSLAAGVPMLGVLVLVGVLAGPVLPVAGRPYDVRELVEQPPPRPMSGVSALDQVSAWLQNPQRELFTVSTTSEANLRLAVLDTFDGVSWTSSAGFVPTGGRVPEAAGERDTPGQQDTAQRGADERRDIVEQRFTLQKLPGPWLPAADRPVRATGPGLVVDPATGALAGTRAREGMTYQVTSGIRRYTAEELRDATPAADPAALRLPDGPDGRTPPQRARLRDLARRATAGARNPAQQAARLAAYLRKLAVNDVNAPPGHGYRSIEFFLTESKRGTTEQFAASFALLARSIGLPTRIVVGFRPGGPVAAAPKGPTGAAISGATIGAADGPADGPAGGAAGGAGGGAAGGAAGDDAGGPAGAAAGGAAGAPAGGAAGAVADGAAGAGADGGVRQVRGGDVLAWAEVAFDGIGWVPFYPTPSRTRAGEGGDVAEGAPKQAREIEQAINSDSSEPKPAKTPTGRSTPTPQPRPGSGGSMFLWLVVPAALVVFYLVAVGVVPAVRRVRARRAASPGARVAGAWRQTVARLRGAGVPVSSGALTAREVASRAEAELGPEAREPLTLLADLANLTTFGAAPVDQADADLAWRQHAAVDALVRRRVPVARRLVRRLSPLSLLR